MASVQDDHEIDESTLGSRSFGGGADDILEKPRLPRIVTAGDELESLCRQELESQQATDLHSRQSDGGSELGGARNASAMFRGFPHVCLPIVKMLAGNHCCVDCGDDDSERLIYASLGYGTLLCQDCAYRHQTNTEQDSQVKSLYEDIWTYRAVLTLLEGSNTQMLEYVKNKPRWRPPKSGKNTDSDDVVAFKQIYLSKAATAYRKLLAKKVDDVYTSQLQAMKEDDEAKERIALTRSLPPPGPFDHIFETMNVTPDQIPGFNQISTSRLQTKRGKLKSGTLMASLNGGVRLAPKILEKEKDSLEVIKERINTRRSLNMQINPNINLYESASNANQFDPYARQAGAAQTEQVPPQRPMFTRRNSVGEVGDVSYRRRSSNTSSGLVGEVGEFSFQDDPVAKFGDDDSYGRNSESGRGMDGRPTLRRLGSVGSGGIEHPRPRRPV